MVEGDALQVCERLTGTDRRRADASDSGAACGAGRARSPLRPTERGQREAEDQIRDVVGAVLREREQEQPERAPRVVVEPAEEAEVEQAEPAVRGQKDVSPVRVGVVDAVHGDLLDVGAEELAREHGARSGSSPWPRVTFSPTTRSCTSTLSVTYGWITSGTTRCSCSATSFAISSDAVRLLDEVELGGEVRLELVAECGQLQQAGRLGVSFGERGQRAEQLEVERDLLLDPRPAHLDDDLAAGTQQPAVDLCDRRTGERLLVEPGEDLEPDLLVDDPARLLEREGRHVVDQPLELLDVDVRKQVGPRREQLAELDEGRAELLEPLPERLRALAGRRPVAD